jgi:hypothetical protein
VQYRTWRLLVSVLCLLTAALSSLAAETSTPSRSVLQGVSALEKPVSYTETKIPLGELVEKVAADTGVKLTATADVADEPVALVVKQLPARELLEQLADLLDYRWARRGKEDAWRYVIWQDLGGKQREAALRAAAFADAERRLREETGRWAEMARLTDAQIQAMRDSAAKQLEKMAALPWDQQQSLLRSPERRQSIDQGQRARVLSRPIIRTLADLAGSLTSEQWALLRGRRRLVFSSQPGNGELLLPARFARQFRAAPYRGSSDRVDGPPQQKQQWDAALHNMQAEWERARGYHVIFQYDARGFMTGQGLYLGATAIPSPSPRASLFEQGNRFGVLGVPGDLDVPGLARPPAVRPAVAVADPVFSRLGVLSPEKVPSEDPIGPARGPVWQPWELLPDLARAYGVLLIFDAYWSTDPVYGLKFPPEAQSLLSQLQHVSGGRYRWDRRGDLVRQRSNTWFLDRPRELPLRLVRGWQDSFSRCGELTLDQYATAAATLTDLQLRSTKRLIHRGVLPADAFSLEIALDARSVLRLYASLTPAQKQTIRAGKEISGSRWSPRQRALFQAVLREGPLPDTRRKLPVVSDWNRAALSMSSIPMTRIGGGGSGSRFSGSERVSGPHPGFWTGPPLLSREAPGLNPGSVSPTAMGGEPRRVQRHRFVWVQFHLIEEPHLSQEVSLYYTAPAP